VGVPIRIVTERRGKEEERSTRQSLDSPRSQSNAKSLLRDSHDDRVSTLQVESQSSSSSREDEDLVRRVGSVELGDEIRSVVGLGRPVESKKTVSVSSVGEVVFKDVHDLDHLEEEENLQKGGRGEQGISRGSTGTREEVKTKAYSMIGREKFWEDPIEEFELSRAPPEAVIADRRWVDGVLDRIQNEGMVANLPELHDGVVETFDDVTFSEVGHRGEERKEGGSVNERETSRVASSARSPSLVDSLRLKESMLPVGGVDPLLESAHLAFDDLLDLVGQLGLDVLLESTKEERSKHLVKSPDDEKLLLLGGDHLV